ncbi:MAG: gamma carbonic anhydrase family protein, partial [Chthoniobacterales bacterium]|nr:gamma carbonic anhydrase family protein [Chthoniobacterales bacterium]
PLTMTIQERLEKYLGRQPDTSKAAFVAPNATILGSVTLGEDASVFYGAILRGDIQDIIIGNGTNVQDGTIIHLADEYPAIIGDYTTIGHGAMIHACTIGNECLIGMRSTILDGAVIGDHCLVAAGAVVTPRTVIPPGSMVMGAPAKVKRQLTDEEIAGLRPWAEKYIHVAKAHAAKFVVK